MNQKAQITIFIIVGIFLLLTAMLIIYFVYSQTKIELKSFPKDLLDNMQKQTIACLEQKTTEAINLLAKQGGLIFEDQNGLKTNGVYEDVEGKRIAVLAELIQLTLSDPSPRTLKISTETPEYPWTTFPKIGNSSKYSSNFLFGMNKIQPLEEDTPEQKSWKSQIQNKVEKELFDCINTPQFQSQGVKITTPKIIMSITDKDVLMSSSVIQLTASDGTTADISPKAKIPINLKKLHSFVMKVIDNEVFDMKNKPQSTVDEYVNVKKINNDNLITITQMPEKVLFQFIIPNRKPALEYIITPTPTETFCEGSTVKINVNKIEIIHSDETSCAKKEIILVGVDPDDDSLSYNANNREENNCLKIKASVKDAQYEDYQEIALKLRDDASC